MATNQWQCDKCGALYAFQPEAEKCEASHSTVDAFTLDKIYFENVSKLWGPARAEAAFVPKSIRIKWGDGFGEFALYELKQVGPRGL